MTISLNQILQKESARLLRETEDVSESDLTDSLSVTKKLRQMVTEVLNHYIDKLSKEELIQLQSSLNVLIDEQMGTRLAKNIERRFHSLTEQVHRDPLTGLPNRAAFDERFCAEVSRAQRYQRDLSVAIFDVDNFKSVNDGFGHQAGDRVLIAVGHLLQSSLRQSDFVFRYGGDEFIAICPETSGQAIRLVLQRLDASLNLAALEDGLPVKISICWGAASYPADAIEAEALIKIADDGLYLCKRARQKAVAVNL